MTTLYKFSLMDQNKFLKHFTKLGISVDEVLQKHPGSHYVGQFPLRYTSGELTDFAADVFYNPEPDRSLGHGNYFAVYVRNGSAYITNADHVEKLILVVYADSNGDYIYSRFQHDFRGFGDENEFFVDGGSWFPSDDYPGSYSMWGRCGGNTIPFGLAVTVRDGQFCKLEQ